MSRINNTFIFYCPLAVWLLLGLGQPVVADSQQPNSNKQLSQSQLVWHPIALRGGQGLHQGANPFYALPESSLCLVLASFLDDNSIGCLVATCRATRRMFGQKFFIGVPWHPVTSTKYDETLAIVERWAQEKAYKNRNTLYIGPADQSLAKGWVPYIESPIVQKKLKGLVLTTQIFAPRVAGVHVMNVTHVSALTNLEALHFRLPGGHISLPCLTRLDHLKTLELVFDTTKDVKVKEFFNFLTQCPQLQEFRMSGLCLASQEDATSVCKTIGQLSQLSILFLREIYFTNSYLLRSTVCRIDWLQGIEDLTLRNWEIHSLSDLPKTCATTLRRLDCSGCTYLHNIEGLVQCKNLEFLNLTDCRRLEAEDVQTVVEAVPSLRVTGYEW